MRYSIDKYNLRFNNTGVDQLIMTENGFGNLNACHCLLRVFTGRSYSHTCIQKFQYIERTSIHFKSKFFFPIASVVVQMIYMALALKGKVLKIVIEKVISTCGRGHYVMQ